MPVKQIGVAMTDRDILHNENAQTLYISLAQGKEALLQYRLMNGGPDKPATIDFTRTYVPPEFRGQGHAEALVRRGIKWATEKNYQLTASCWYAAKFIGKDTGVMQTQ